MTEPVPRNAEVALQHPDKSYGTFRRSTHFETGLDADGISLTLERADSGEPRKAVRMRFHYLLFAHILCELAKTVSATAPRNAAHRAALLEAATALCRALGADADSSRSGRKAPARLCKKGHLSALSPEEEEVLLLHVLE